MINESANLIATLSDISAFINNTLLTQSTGLQLGVIALALFIGFILRFLIVKQVARLVKKETGWAFQLQTQKYASQIAELDMVPCLIKDVPDEAAVAIALIENIQREDLNAMEEALALNRLMTEFQLTHQELADAVGKSRTAVSNLLRLNNLNDDVKLMLERGDLEMGHARALLSLEGEQQSDAAKLVTNKSMTVRDAENMVRKMLQPASDEKKQPVAAAPDVKKLEGSLSEDLGAPVSISHNAKGKGKLVINFSDLDQLDGILAKIQH